MTPVGRKGFGATTYNIDRSAPLLVNCAASLRSPKYRHSREFNMRHLTLGLAALLLGAFAVGCSTENGGGGGDGGGSGELTIESFLASPNKIAPGKETILSWKTKNATSIRIFDGKNDRIGQGTENEGSVTVTLEETTTFRLVAQNSTGDSKEATVQVVVQDEVGPALSFSANQTRLDFESSTFLRWDSTGAVRVVVAVADGGEVLVDTDKDADKTKLSGDHEITPIRTTIYEATATDENGLANTQSVEVIVDPVVTTFSSTLTHPIPIGTEVTLNWIARGAEAMEITTPEGENYTVPESDLAAGEATMIAGESGIFTLKATRGKGEKIREYKAQMRELPVVDLFEATPDAINAGQPTPVTLAWKVSNADTIQIVAEGGTVIVPTTTELEGSKGFTASAATTYTLTAVNLAGETSRDVTVRAVARPEIVSFTATPNRVTPFGTTRLAWTTANATVLTLEQTDDQGEVTQHTIPQGDEGTFDVNVSSRSTFRLVAKNDANTSIDATAVVEIGPPVVDSFTTSQARFGNADPIVLSWTGRGGRSAKVFSIERNGDGDPINPALECEETFPAVASSGTCTVPAQATFGRYEFQLVLEDGTFSDTAFVTALVSDGPVIERFLASPAQIDEGDSTTISWMVQNDAAGNPPELTLKVNGAEVELPSEMEDNPQNGTATLDFPNAGRFRLELSATSDGGTTFTDTATMIVTVVGTPSIDTFTATPDTVEDSLPVTLAWTMTNVSRAAIHDASNNALLFSIPANRLNAGSHQLAPTGVSSITYRLVAYNPNNVKVEDEVTVTVTPPTAQIVSFTAPATANAGDVITLEWITRGGTDVLLTPVMGAATLLSNAPFEDISATGTALTMVGCGSMWDGPLGDGCATVTFPNGFTFPFDGQQRTALDVYVDGFISFDVGANVAGNDPANFPGNPAINLAPFWDDLTIGAGTPAGAIHFQQKTGSKGDYLVVQWSHARNNPMGMTWMSLHSEVDLNFQVVLWANGAAEYRYGTMVSPAGMEDEANGVHSVIGFQDTDVAFVDVFSATGMVVPGGLGGRSWGYFEQSQLPSDTVQLTVDKTTIFTLCLEHAGGRICQDRTVTVN